MVPMAAEVVVGLPGLPNAILLDPILPSLLVQPLQVSLVQALLGG